MESQNSSLDDLWKSLESEALSEPADQAHGFERPAFVPSRRRTLTDKLFAAVLGGIVPMLLILFLGILVGLQNLDTQRASVFAIAAMLAVPTALSASCLLRIEHLSPLRILVVTALGSSLGAVGLCSLSLGIFMVVLGDDSNMGGSLEVRDLIHWAGDLQRLYLSQLHPIAWLSILVAAFAVWGLARLLRPRAPWLEPASPPRKWRHLFAGLTLLSPWLFLGVCTALQGHIAPRELAWVKQQAPHLKLLRPDPSSSSKAWRNLRDSTLLADSAWSRDTDVAPTWPKAFHRELEGKVLQMVPAKPQDQLSAVRVLDALLHRPKETREPLALAFESIELLSLQRPAYPYPQARQARRAGEALLSTLATGRLSLKELTHAQTRLHSLFEQQLSPEEELESKILQTLAWDFDREGIPEVHPSNFPVVNVIRETFSLRPRLSPWFDLQDKIDYTDYPKFEHSIRKAEASLGESVPLKHLLGYASQACYGLLLAPTLEQADLVISLRLHRASHGTYPDSLKQLADSDRFQPEEWTYRSLGTTARLARTTPDSEVTPWELP